MNNRLKILKILSGSERKFILVILTLAIIVALLEIATAASLLPFLALLSDPSSIQSNPIANFIFDDTVTLDFQKSIIIIGAISFGTLSVTSVTKIATLFVQSKFFETIRSDISIRLFDLYGRQSELPPFQARRYC